MAKKLLIYSQNYDKWVEVLGVFEGIDEARVPYKKYKIADPKNKYSQRVNDVFLIYKEPSQAMLKEVDE